MLSGTTECSENEHDRRKSKTRDEDKKLRAFYPCKNRFKNAVESRVYP